MEKKINVCIGIQARSTSTRFPNKITQLVGGKMVIDRVIDSCESCAGYINRYSFTNNIYCSVFVLIPHGDPIRDSLRLDPDKIIEGDENDVMARYVQMAEDNDATYIVRITADCPLIPHFVIYKCINSAIKNGFDYFSNVGDVDSDEMRTSIDGHDVEVISKAAMDWMNKNAVDIRDREHVTTLLRGDDAPSFFRRGILIGHNDQSKIKLSLDTLEDLDKIREEHEKIERKVFNAKKKYGKNSVHRF